MSGPNDKSRDRTVKDRWWVESGDKERERGKRASGPVGASFFRAGEGYEQDRAHDRLTDTNLKLLHEASPPEAGWGYVQLTPQPYPERERERIKKLVALPPYARAAFIDSGRMVRILVTGTPVGARILELALGEVPSFDCWVDNEWMGEALFEDADTAIAALRRHIAEYLSPEGIERWRERHVQP